VQCELSVALEEVREMQPLTLGPTPNAQGSLGLKSVLDAVETTCISSEPTTPEAAAPVPRGSVRFLWVTASVLALSLLLVIVAAAWPLPPAYTATGAPNPAWQSAVQMPSAIAHLSFLPYAAVSAFGIGVPCHAFY
jgi:hypothetical protein